MAGRDDSPGWPVMVSAVLVAAAVSAAVAAAMMRFADEESPAIASVRLGEIAGAWAVDAAGGGGSAEEAGRQARRWAAALETALRTVSDRRGAVLLPARAVAAGAPDVTGEVEAELGAILAGGTVRPGGVGP